MNSAIRTLLLSTGAVALATTFLPADEARAQTQDRTLRVGVWDLPPGRGNPYTGSGTPSILTWSAIYDALTFIDLSGKPTPALAQRWRNVDPTTWEFTLRPNVKFHNGVPFTAQTLVDNIAWLQSDEGRTKGPSVSTRISFIAEASAPDAMTLRIKTKTPNPIVPAEISNILVVEPKAWKDDFAGFVEKPIGTGTYRLDSMVDNQSAKLTANDGHWTPPKIRRLEVFDIPERPARLQAFQSNQLDVVLGLTPDNLPLMQQLGAKVDIRDGAQVLTWAFTQVNAREGLDVKPFQDKRVRQALNYAVNKQSLVDDLLQGKGGIAMGQGVPTAAYGHNPNVKPYPYDPERAKRLLAEAGYPNLSFVVEVVPGAFPADGEIFQQTAADLKKIGVNAEVRVVSFADWLKKFFPVGWEGPVWHNLWGSAPAMDATAAILNQSCDKGGKPYICDKDGVQEKLRAQISSEFDAAKRLELIHQLIAHQHEEAVNLFLIQFANLHATHKNVDGFVNINQFINYHEMRFNN